MGQLPTTSITLLKAIAASTDSVRWTEFYNRYEPMMRAYLLAHHPTLEADDIIQDTMISLMKVLPGYQYTPDDKGHFRNYLVGILKHKAFDALRNRATLERTIHRATQGDTPTATDPQSAAEERQWRETVMSAAVDQLMADPTILSMHREVFRHVALMHEPPEAVARKFGISRNNVDQIKKRMVDRLRALAAAMGD